ncbi:MAG: hypothetical protein AAF533_08500 [Acidobacteriota bacterium]
MRSILLPGVARACPLHSPMGANEPSPLNVGDIAVYHVSVENVPGLTASWSASGGTVLARRRIDRGPEALVHCAVRWTSAGSGQVTVTLTAPSCTQDVTRPVNVLP